MGSPGSKQELFPGELALTWTGLEGDERTVMPELGFGKPGCAWPQTCPGCPSWGLWQRRGPSANCHFNAGDVSPATNFLVKPHKSFRFVGFS